MCLNTAFRFLRKENRKKEIRRGKKRERKLRENKDMIFSPLLPPSPEPTSNPWAAEYKPVANWSFTSI